METEEPSRTTAFRQRWGIPDDVNIAPLPGGVAGSFLGFLDWIKARYPDEAEAEIREFCDALHVPDEHALRERLLSNDSEDPAMEKDDQQDDLATLDDDDIPF